MELRIHKRESVEIAEVLSDEVMVKDVAAGLDLLMDVYYQGYDRLILYEKNMNPAFFDLKTGIAGELLQKFSNYRMRLVIVGSFTKNKSKALHDFIAESNRGRQVNFVESVEEALMRLIN